MHTAIARRLTGSLLVVGWPPSAALPTWIANPSLLLMLPRLALQNGCNRRTRPALLESAARRAALPCVAG